MAVLDVALRLRLLNGIKPGAREATRDLEGVSDAARKLNGIKGGDALARDLGRVAKAGGQADAAIRRVAADGAALSATGTAAGRLGGQLVGIATAGGRADAALRRVAADATVLSGAGTGRLGAELAGVAAAGGRADAAIRRVAADRVALSAMGTAAGRLGGQLVGVATAGGRADAALRRVAADVAAVSGAGTGRLGADLAGVAAAGGRADAAVRGIGAGRAGLAGLDAVARALAADLDRVAAAGRRASAAVPRSPRSAPVRTDPDSSPTTERPRTIRRGSERRDPNAGLRQDSREAIRAAGLSRYGPAGAVAAGVYGAGKSYVEFADVERRMTRIGLTAEATRAEMRGVTREAMDLAIRYAMPFDKVAGGYEALAAQGRKMAEIRQFMPSVTATAQASGADVADIANSAGAIGEQMGVAAPRMQAAFDILVAGGKAGKFELKDMARYLPSLAPLAASVGLKGEEGLRRLVAIAQVVRNQTGTAEEAASSLNNIFAKMESKETTKNFKDMGIDLEEAMKKARAEGRDLITVFVELADKAVGGDLSKLPKLINDMEFARGVRALLSQKGAVDKFAESFRKVDGTVLADLGVVLGDSRAKIDRMSGSWERFKTQLGESLSPIVTPTLESITGALKDLDTAIERSKATGSPREGRMLSDEGQAKVNRTLNRIYYGTDSAEDQRVARAESGQHRRDATDHNAGLGDEIARQEADITRMEAIKGSPLRAPMRRALIEAAQTRIEALRAQMAEIDAAAAEIDKALAAYKATKDLRQRYGSIRIRQGGDGLDPTAQGDASGGNNFFPAPGEERPRFTLAGVPNGPDRFASPEAPKAPTKPAPAPGPHPLDRVEDVVSAKPDRFSLDGGAAARAEMKTAMEAYAARKRAEAPAVVVRPPTTARFDLGGPVAAGPAGIERAPGTATKFPMAESLSKATFDPQPIISGVRQAEDAAKGLQTTLNQDLSGPARQSMETFNGALSAGTRQAVATVVAAAAQMQAALSFTATPTIAPRMVPPPSGGAGTAPASAAPVPASRAPRVQSAGLRRSGSAGSTFTGPIHVHGVRDVASLHRGIQREADRRVRDSRDNALHDTGPEVA